MVSDNQKDIRQQAAAALQWYSDMGANEAVSALAVDRFEQSAALANSRAKPATHQHARQNRQETQPAASPPASGQLNHRPTSSPAMQQAGRPPRQPQAAATMPVEEVEALAQSCKSLDELAHTLDDFDACPLKRTATRLCFADGLPGADVMIVGEAPGRDEDEQGRPFVGKSGQLLDKMLHCIGLDRRSDDPARSVFISNIVFWRPPGNRKPSSAEVIMCLPFLRRAIELARPKIVVAAGATPAHALMNTTTGITRLRGKWSVLTLSGHDYPLMPTLHPSYLLRSPGAKREAWTDWLSVKEKSSAWSTKPDSI